MYEIARFTYSICIAERHNDSKITQSTLAVVNQTERNHMILCNQVLSIIVIHQLNTFLSHLKAALFAFLISYENSSELK